MADLGFDEENEEITLNSDKTTEIIDEQVKAVLGSATWNPRKVDQWTSQIMEQCLKRLAELKKPFKFIITCVIMQRTGAGLHSAFTAHWDNSSDAICSLPYESETLHCVTTVFGLKLD
eukprot:TRINITY_DN23462_c0_g1_i1.p1 TRINITY_DN23462_c0_g1~~TRINITY_DN23462_c0_g1_i1.p1  ORF type:complete len:118 (-),score=10.20 TRINITY_DN23462_c0_g1_i1:169-522(-)